MSASGPPRLRDSLRLVLDQRAGLGLIADPDSLRELGADLLMGASHSLRAGNLDRLRQEAYAWAISVEAYADPERRARAQDLDPDQFVDLARPCSDEEISLLVAVEDNWVPAYQRDHPVAQRLAEAGLLEWQEEEGPHPASWSMTEAGWAAKRAGEARWQREAEAEDERRMGLGPDAADSDGSDSSDNPDGSDDPDDSRL